MKENDHEAAHPVVGRSFYPQPCPPGPVGGQGKDLAGEDKVSVKDDTEQRKIQMTGIKKFGTKRFEYLKRRQPEVLSKLEDHGILETHLRYAQMRADQHLNRLVMAGVEEFEAEEIVLREIIPGIILK